MSLVWLFIVVIIGVRPREGFAAVRGLVAVPLCSAFQFFSEQLASTVSSGGLDSVLYGL